MIGVCITIIKEKNIYVVRDKAEYREKDIGLGLTIISFKYLTEEYLDFLMAKEEQVREDDEARGCGSRMMKEHDDKEARG